MGRRLILALLTAAAVCGGDDDEGGGGGGGPGQAACSGTVSGSSAGGFTGCVATINHLPDGSGDLPEHWIYTLIAVPEAGAELDEPLESLGINLFLAGAPAPGSYSLADAQPDTHAFVYAPLPTEYRELTAITLIVAGMDDAGETDLEGDRVLSYWPSGSLEMTLAGESGSVTVEASF